MSNTNTPAWQTEELQDEWVDLEPEGNHSDDDNLTYGTHSISLTAPLATHIHPHDDHENQELESGTTPNPVGTFIVREDVPRAPFLPKTPGRNPAKGLIKDFFSPLPLERMFEPPSPPAPPSHPNPLTFKNPGPSRLSQTHQDEIIGTDVPNTTSFDDRKPSMACQFTFTVPRENSLNPNNAMGSLPQAQSTPNPPLAPNVTAPLTDPRLRLFQFQYDTYTREHLSAMVDSIAINTPSGSGSTPSPTSFNQGLSRVSEATGGSVNLSHLRSSKRVKLSPRSDFYGEGAGEGASIARPKIFGKDYVGESQSLMQQIKQARDFSTISTVLSAQADTPSVSNKSDSHGRGYLVCFHYLCIGGNVMLHFLDSPRAPSFLAVPERSNSNPLLSNDTVGSRGAYSSSTYRQQAAALMAQIKSDMKGQKRIFSGGTDVSSATTHLDEKEKSFMRSPETVSVQLSSYSQEDKDIPRRRISSHSRTASINQIIRSEHGLKLVLESHPPFKFTPPSNLAPASYPSSSIRGTNDDLNRFVSSSTASGTTLTAGSVPSFVKHPGPVQIRTIAPGDLPALPEQLGDMLFDKVMMKWVKNTAQATRVGEDYAQEEPSEDPFGDIESLRDDSRVRDAETSIYVPEPPETHELEEMSRIDERSESEDAEEMALTSFSTDGPSAHIVDVMTGVDTDNLDIDGDQTTDSADDDDLDLEVTQPETREVDFDSEEDMPPGSEATSPPRPLMASSYAPLVTPHRTTSMPVSTTPIIRSALKSHSVTPSSALRDPTRRKAQRSPHNRGHRRSVSFSDGRRDGPIQGLSARSKRIADMMNALEGSDTSDTDSPSKASGSGSRPEELQPFTRHLPESSHSRKATSDSPRRTFSRSQTQRSLIGNETNPNATFLTECSFGVAHDRLVQVITDVQPFEPHWEELNYIDLSNKKLESVARMKEFLPRLDALSLNSNQLAWLSGIPGTVRTLSVASNCLTGLTSYGHLRNLENLDISRNDVESLRQLACLRHLRELKADGNKVTSIDGLEHMDGLVKLSLQGNCIQSVDLAQNRWTRLEMLNLSHNRLDSIYGLASLPSLIALNIDHNVLGNLELDGPMPKLRILRISGNRLHQLHVAPMPNLRTLYADNNSLSSLVKVNRLTKLEHLSLRNQSGRGLNLLTRDVRDVKRLYLSGNPLKPGFLEEPCYNLVYLELAACRLTALPEDMSRLLPNLRVLNLNYNFLEDARPLEGLTRLRKLTIIGSRLKGSKPLIRLLQRMPDVEMLDFRMNPCTLGWYLPLLVKDVPGALQPSEGAGEGKKGEKSAHGWQELDSKFRRDLPDDAYIGRLAYRGLVMRACGRIRMLDGVEVSEKERVKAHQLLVGIVGRGKKAKGKGGGGWRTVDGSDRARLD
ncbi:hypothetical protein BD779DRAFT_1797151 [Infundibulicybe gibba]|nr:hypothetical protein BD779DRAFT_1797151 [Infundibulicybe gibba]